MLLAFRFSFWRNVSYGIVIDNSYQTWFTIHIECKISKRTGETHANGNRLRLRLRQLQK